MLWYCHFTWHPTTTREKIAQRIVQQHDAGENHPENIRGWYSLVGGGAGFLMLETEDFQDVTAFCAPYADLVFRRGWDDDHRLPLRIVVVEWEPDRSNPEPARRR